MTEKHAHDLAAMLDGLLKARCGTIHNGDYFERSWETLWNEIVDGGWLDVGTSFRDEAQFPDALVDLACVAEVWARHLVPLPYIENVLRRFVTGAVGGARAVDGNPTIGLGGGAVLVLRPLAPPTDDVDRFAPSLPIVRRTGTAVSSPEELRTSAVLWAAEAVGCASAAFDSAVDYSRVREAYGSQIGSYQAIQHLLADSYKDLELARSGVIWAVHARSQSWLAAADVMDRASTIISNAVQIHGGTGFTWEYGLHFFHRHVAVLQKLLRVAGQVDITDSAREEVTGS